MYKRLLYSNSLVMTYYFVLSFLILFIVNVAHHTIIKKNRQNSNIQRLAEDGDIKDENLISPENSKYHDETVSSELDSQNEADENRLKKRKLTVPYRVITVNPGDTVSAILEQSGISAEETSYIVKALAKVLNLRKINTGSEITIRYVDNGGVFDKIDKIEVSTGSSFKYEVINFGENNYQSKALAILVDKYFVKKEVTINSNFIASATSAGIPKNIVLSLVKAFSYDIDFQRDIKVGDKIEVLYDKFYTQEGKFSHVGSVQFASLKLRGKDIAIYRHIDQQGEEHFYNKDGKTIVKSLLRTPINAARISSSFGMRKHPVLGYTRMHKGIDFAARVGTPILSAGNGVVEVKGIKSGYGNYIRIRHNNIYSTAYAHISKFPKNIKVGSRVKQGEVIAYVGNTGVTNGPHLHYEVHKHGVQINPQSLKLTSFGEKLAGNELKRLKKTIQRVSGIIGKFNAKQTEIKVSAADFKKLQQ